jgi:hypothetical protein
MSLLLVLAPRDPPRPDLFLEIGMPSTVRTCAQASRRCSTRVSLLRAAPAPKVMDAGHSRPREPHLEQELTFATETGQVYELDPDRPRVRRLTSAAPRTDRLSPDGEWKDYFLVSSLVVGQQFTIVWSIEAGTAKSTLTSRVTSVG